MLGCWKASFIRLEKQESCSSIIDEVFKLQTGGDPSITDEDKRSVDASLDKACIMLNSVRNGPSLRKDTFTGITASSADDFLKADLMIVPLATRDPVSLCTIGTHLQLNGPENLASRICDPKSSDQLSPRGHLPIKLENSRSIEIDQGVCCEFVKLPLYVLAATCITSLTIASRFFDFCHPVEGYYIVTRVDNVIADLLWSGHGEGFA